MGKGLPAFDTGSVGKGGVYTPGGWGSEPGPGSGQGPSFTAGSSYITAIAPPSEKPAEQKAITSLAPGGNSNFSNLLRDGEKAFREGDLDTALSRFESANQLDRQNPEGLLSLVHIHFAMSRSSYFRASFYLMRTIKCVPELPLAPLNPAGFFNSPQQYSDALARLDGHVKAAPTDGEAWLVLAYFRWFDKNVNGAIEAISQARQQSSDPDVKEAVETFWRGMKASGKVSGELGESPVATTAPAPSSQPSPAGSATP
ncbi:MAG: hypothetical protein WC869_05990 [Phycisphaerae bacterium]